MQFKLKKFLIIVAFVVLVCGFWYLDTLKRLYHGYRGYRASQERVKYYHLDGCDIQDITETLIADTAIPNDLKLPLIEGKRRIVIFKYLSGSSYVAGYLSYLTQNSDAPVLIFLRGGNGNFGIARPNNRFSFLEGYNVVGTLYRGNIYGGVDELGGDEIHDIENLIKFFPQLEKFTNISFKAPYGMLGVSRGAMEMFISLSRLEYVKSRISNAISVSGNVDLNVSMSKRPEMKYLFRKKFKESNCGDFDSWLQFRNPVCNTSQLSKSLRVLLVYGLDDKRVFLEEQQNLKNALDLQKIDTELVTIPGADHGLDGHFEEFENTLKKFMSQSLQ